MPISSRSIADGDWRHSVRDKIIWAMTPALWQQQISVDFGAIAASQVEKYPKRRIDTIGNGLIIVAEILLEITHLLIRHSTLGMLDHRCARCHIAVRHGANTIKLAARYAQANAPSWHQNTESARSRNDILAPDVLAAGEFRRILSICMKYHTCRFGARDIYRLMAIGESDDSKHYAI